MKNGIASFKISSKYLCDIPNIKDIFFIFQCGRKERGKSYSLIDHPKFTELRQALESQGYIKIEKSWSNGDIVLKPFFLNGKKFNTGEKFLCATALQIKFKTEKNIGIKK